MNIAERTSLSLLLVSLSAIPANADMNGDSGPGGVSIETAGSGKALQPLDRLLGGGNNSDLFRSVLKQHDSSSQATKVTMEGHFGSEGGEQPVANRALQAAPSEAPAEAPNLSLSSATAHVGSAQADISPVSTASPTSSGTSGSPVKQAVSNPTVPNQTVTYTTTIIPAVSVPDPSKTITYHTTIVPVTPVPLPAAGLLLASGLAGMAGIRRLRQRPE